MITYRLVGMLSLYSNKVDDIVTKESIIIVALRLSLTRGYKSVSLMDVANELGITKGGIYHYFSSKDDLLRAALRFSLDRFERKYAELVSERNTIQEILHCLLVDRTFEGDSRELIGLPRECSVDHVHFYIEMMRKFPDIQEKVQKIQVLTCETLAKRIQVAIDKGEIKSGLDSYAVAANIMAMVNGQKSLGSHFQCQEMRKRMMDTMWTLMNS